MQLALVLTRMLQAINTADVDEFLEVCAPHAVIHDGGERFAGRSGLVEWFAMNAVGSHVEVRPIEVRSARGRYELRVAWRCEPFHGEPIVFDIGMSALITNDRLQMLEITSLS